MIRIYDLTCHVDLAGLDVMQAVKAMPDVAAGLVAAAFTLVGMVLALFGLIGSKPTAVSNQFQLDGHENCS